MSKRSSLNKMARYSIIGTPLLTIAFCILLYMQPIYYWDVFWPTYRNILYTLSIAILVGLLYIYFVTKNYNSTFKILVFIFTIPLFGFGSLILFDTPPSVLDTKQLNNNTYYLFAEKDFLKPHTYIRLLECKTASFECKQTSLEESADPPNRDYYLRIDPEKTEVHVLSKSHITGYTNLLYTYGTYTRYYGFPEELNGNLYYLATNNSRPGQITIYTMYECNLESTSCDLIPFEYKGFGIISRLEINETTSEVDLFIYDEIDQPKLIYTYGKNPKCYAEGCEILK